MLRKHIKEENTSQVWVGPEGFFRDVTCQLTPEMGGVKAMLEWSIALRGVFQEEATSHAQPQWLFRMWHIQRQQEKANMAGAWPATESVRQRRWGHGFQSSS